eukprot:NODE_3598_length_937_cov_44.809877_g3446_i0.p1 GENE.NODE_3598_length_937_cov_44.809877_g3446_i0~~NODE_3598_length_937_cov_44.809877_g3446_i0.p1  ORF type:complete len:294 (-),score=72.06 NODE_3598_length_937_cov_44.809877_g3446_i0:56-874(-)
MFGLDFGRPAIDLSVDPSHPPTQLRFHLSDPQVEQLKKNCEVAQVVLGASVLSHYVLTSTALQHTDCPFAAQLTKADIIAGTYEGGFKLWSCAVDLLRYLTRTQFSFTGKSVLEAGCGHGLPGIYALQHGADSVLFQDYNAEVLSFLTMQNVVLNTCPRGSTMPPGASFWSGDWGGFTESTVGQFEVVLTSDTLYTPLSTGRLVALLRRVLKKPDGVAFIASKSLYFGCGGGVYTLRQLVEETNEMQVEQMELIADGSDVQREIVRISFRSL